MSTVVQHKNDDIIEIEADQTSNQHSNNLSGFNLEQWNKKLQHNFALQLGKIFVSFLIDHGTV